MTLTPPSVFLAPPFLSPADCFSFWACIIACLFFSASSSLFLFSSASFAFFSASSFLNRSSSSFFCWASFFSCSARISFLLACFSFSRFSSSSSLARCFLHSLMYSLSCSSSSPFFASWRAFRKFPSPLGGREPFDVTFGQTWRMQKRKQY